MPEATRIPLRAAAACAGAFVVLLAIAYGLGFAERADASALNGLMTLRGSEVRPILSFFALSADPLPVAAMLAAIALAGLAAGRRRQAVAAVAMVGAAAVTTEALKVVLAHPRLDPALGVHQLGAAAFPSGHATGAMALALAAVLVAAPRLRPLAVAVGAAYAIAVSTSILVLGWHFPSDVFGGMLVASFYFCLAVAGLRAFAGRAEAGTPISWSRPPLPRRRELVAVAALVALVVVVARAGELATYASAHTTATAAAVAIAACSAGLIYAAAALAGR